MSRPTVILLVVLVFTGVSPVEGKGVLLNWYIHGRESELFILGLEVCSKHIVVLFDIEGYGIGLLIFDK